MLLGKNLSKMEEEAEPQLSRPEISTRPRHSSGLLCLPVRTLAASCNTHDPSVIKTSGCGMEVRASPASGWSWPGRVATRRAGQSLPAGWAPTLARSPSWHILPAGPRLLHEPLRNTCVSPCQPARLGRAPCASQRPTVPQPGDVPEGALPAVSP